MAHSHRRRRHPSISTITRLHHQRCPPCKAFSPVLIDFYNTCKDDLEVIYISSDRDDKSFGDYFGKMPWVAMMPAYMSNEQRDRQGKLADMFKIQVCIKRGCWSCKYSTQFHLHLNKSHTNLFLGYSNSCNPWRKDGALHHRQCPYGGNASRK